MAKRGDEARAKVYEVIQKAFGEDFVAVVDKKIYVNSKEDGEKIQFAISITMPKTPIGESADFDFTSDVIPSNSAVVKPSKRNEEFSEKERDAVAKLMEELGL